MNYSAPAVFAARRASIAVHGALAVVALAAVALVTPTVHAQSAVSPMGTYGEPSAGDAATVDLVSGTARASLALDLPKPRGDVAIGISLGCTSPGGENEAGMGCGFNLPAIERHNAAGPPLYRDPKAGLPPEPWAWDRFTYQGAPLVYVCMVGEQGCDHDVPAQYAGFYYFRRERELGFERFLWSPDLRTWVIQQPDGETLELGAPVSVPQITAAEASGIDWDLGRSEPAPFRWRIVRRFDARRDAGHQPVNLVVYSYLVASHSGLKSIHEIFDTPSAEKGPASLPTYAHHVRFSFAGSLAPSFEPTTRAPVWRARHDTYVTAIDVTSATEKSTERQLVHRYLLGYEMQRGRVHLTRFQVEGCERATENADGVVPPSSACAQLPPTLLAYYPEILAQRAWTRLGEGTPFSSRAGQAPLTPSLPANVSLTDISADGMPDFVQVLDTPTDFQHLWINTGSQLRYADLKATTPSGGQLFAPSRSVSIQGDWMAMGRVTVLNSSGAGYPSAFVMQTAERAGAGWKWTESENLTLPTFHRVIDIDGDGLLDAYTGILQTYPPNLPDVEVAFSMKDTPRGRVEPFVRKVSYPKQSVTRSDFTWDQYRMLGTWMTDMDADGITDLVMYRTWFHTTEEPRWSDAQIVYFPGDAQGGFACANPELCDNRWPFSDKPIAMKDGADPYTASLLAAILSGHMGAYVHDINADGRGDLIVTHQTTIDVFLNEGGLRFGPKTTMAHPRLADGVLLKDTRLIFGDVNGSGTDDLVLLTGKSVRYLDWLQGTRPGLLMRVQNGYGGGTIYEYSSLAQLDATAEERTKKPWQDHAPMNVPLVTRLKRYNSLDPPFRVELSTAFDYRDPAYDAWERKIVGFGTVTERVEDGASVEASRTTETLYYFGACQRSSQSCANVVQALRDPDRTKSGLPYKRDVRRAETYLSTTIYENEPIYIAGLPNVQFAYAKQTDTYLYETSPFTKGNGNVEVTIFSGALDRSPAVKVKVPLHSRDYEHLRTTRKLDQNGRLVMSIDHGRIHDDGSPIDDPIVHKENWTRVASDTAWTFRKLDESTAPFAARPGVPQGFARAQRYEYDGAGGLEYEYAQLEGGVALDRHHEDPRADLVTVAPGASSLTPHEVTTHYITDRFGNVTMVQDPTTGRCQTFDHDPLHRQLVVGQSTFPGAICGMDPLTTTLEYDRGSEAVTRMVTPNGAEKRTRYDVFGRPVAHEKPDPRTGATTGEASATIAYDEQPSPVLRQVHTVRSDGSEAWAFADGLGNLVETFEKAEPSAEGAPQWVASELAIRDRQGLVTTSYEPFFVEVSDPVPHVLELPPAAKRATKTYAYDGFARPTLALDRDGTQLFSITYHKLLTETHDAESLLTGGLHTNTPTYEQRDGHGRVVRQAKVLHKPSSYTEETTFDYLATGEVARVVHSSGGVDSTVHWMLYDSLGRLVVSAQPDASVNFSPPGSATLDTTSPNRLRTWRYAYNDHGELVGTSDARGCGRNLHLDNEGRPIAEDFSPCTRAQAPYSGPNPLTGAGTEAFYVYGSSGFEKDMVTTVRDRAAETTLTHDARGRVTKMQRRLATPGTPRVNPADRYSATPFVTEAGYDSLDRVNWRRTGVDVPELQGSWGGSSYIQSHSWRGMLTDVISGYGNASSVLAHMEYAADGSPTSITYGDAAGTRQTLGYDARNRLETVTVDRSQVPPWTARPPGYTPPPVGSTSTTQSLLASTKVTRDALGNILHEEDSRVGDEWPEGAQPVSRDFVFDDLYRVTSTTYRYGPPGSQATDKHVSPFEAERAKNSRAPVPTTNRQTRVKSQGITFDWKGNVTSSTDDQSTFFDRSIGAPTYASAAPHQIVSATAPKGSLSAKHDAMGNMTELVIVRTEACEDAEGKCSHSFLYDWDEVGQLARAQRWDYAGVGPASGRPAMEVAYAYDAEGRRVLKTVTDSADPLRPRYSAEVFATLRLDDAEWKGTDYERTALTESAVLGAIARVVYAPEDAETGTSGRKRVLFNITDRLGSMSAIIDKDTSELVERSTYQPFGGAESDYRPKRWGSYRDPYRFTGKEDDTEVGLTYFGERYYHPRLGRWLSADPLSVHAAGSDPNPYAYVRGQLVNAVDPTGLQSSSDVEDVVAATHRDLPPPAMNDFSVGIDATSANAAYFMDGVVLTAEEFTVVGLPPSAEDTRGWFRKFLFDLEDTKTLEDSQSFANGYSNQMLFHIPDLVFWATGMDKRINNHNTAHDAGSAIGFVASLVTGKPGPGLAARLPGVPIHHLATIRNMISKARGGPWTPTFAKLFKQARTSMQSAANKVGIPGHKGPHPEAYHKHVYNTLRAAVRGIKPYTNAYRDKFNAALDGLRADAAAGKFDHWLVK